MISLLVYTHTQYIYITCILVLNYVYIVLALKDIAKTLGKTDWDFSVHPCSEQRVWRPDVDIEGSDNAVICSTNCSSANINDDTECQVHVTNM